MHARYLLNGHSKHSREQVTHQHLDLLITSVLPIPIPDRFQVRRVALLKPIAQNNWTRSLFTVYTLTRVLWNGTNKTQGENPKGRSQETRPLVKVTGLVGTYQLQRHGYENTRFLQNYLKNSHFLGKWQGQGCRANHPVC